MSEEKLLIKGKNKKLKNDKKNIDLKHLDINNIDGENNQGNINEKENKPPIEKQIEILNNLNEQIINTKPSKKYNKKDGKSKKEQIKNPDDNKNDITGDFKIDLTNLNENQEDKIERMKLIEQYSKYRSTFKFTKDVIDPKKLSLDELKFEIELLQSELNGKGSMLAFSALLMTSFTILEHSSKLLNIGLRLDGLTKAVDENKEEFNNIMKELLIKYNIFSPGPETRFILLVAKTVYITHHMNMAIEKKKEIINNTDPSVIENLKTKFNKI